MENSLAIAFHTSKHGARLRFTTQSVPSAFDEPHPTLAAGIVHCSPSLLRLPASVPSSDWHAGDRGVKVCDHGHGDGRMKVKNVQGRGLMKLETQERVCVRSTPYEVGKLQLGSI
ncbi:hypothetical protein GJ744_004631 [Endocarpon pusillum]|uniref:Uncharacterized protein n=1 Tax=Endocarpon pusillum TaxID=364733 RepID=A0A8H7ANT3_9EURO|nr:hypothetical protein GJ744_004631 [Endocarpon pusillum]